MSIYNDTLGSVCAPAAVYNFNTWEAGTKLWYEPFNIRELIAGVNVKPKNYGIVTEIKKGTSVARGIWNT